MTCPPSRPIVLVAEDEPIVRLDAMAAFESQGFDVLEAEDGASALALVDQGAPVDLLFTDVNMPGDLDGIELAIRTCELRPQMRVIVTSGRPLPSRALPCHGRFVAKPYVTSEICRLARTLLAEEA